MSININIDVNRLIENSLSPIAEPAMNTIAAIWGLTFGRIDNYYEMKQLTDAKNLEDFRDKLEQEIEDIPEDSLQEPTLSIAGPALEASKYFYKEEELRDMFAKLVASSMDSSKINDVYPSFAEIIKQMSKLDAQNLRIISTGSQTARIICKIQVSNSSGSYNTIYSNVYIANSEASNLEDVAASLTNLVRLGLIEIDYSQYLADEELYDVFKETDYYSHAIIFSDTRNTPYEQINQQDFGNDDDLDSNEIVTYNSPEIIKGLISVTPFGHKFISTCL